MGRVPLMGAGTAGSSPLHDSLISFWNLDEASGTRNDSVGTNHLTDNNTVTQAVGKIAEAAQFTRANSESLSIASNATLVTGDIDFTFAAWVYQDSSPGAGSTYYIASKAPEWILLVENVGSRLDFYINDTLRVRADAFGAPPTATWYFVVVWHDATANTINIQVNNGTVNSQATGATVPPTSTNPFYLGQYGSGATFWDGRIDAVGFWKRVLTAAERTSLYNSGNGQQYPLS